MLRLLATRGFPPGLAQHFWCHASHPPRRGDKSAHPHTMRGGCATDGTWCHASPARDARLPSVSDLKQNRCAVLRFRVLASVHPRCSRRLSTSGWDGWTRTNGCGSQSPVPYHLATPQYDEARAGADAPALSHSMGWIMGLEPTTPGTTIRCSAN